MCALAFEFRPDFACAACGCWYFCCSVWPQEATVMTRHSFLLFCAASIMVVLCATAEAAGKPEPLSLKAPAFLGSTGGDVIVRLRIEPDARSRELTIEWEAEDLSGGSHAIMLDGVRAAATHQFAIKRLSAGQHVV